MAVIDQTNKASHTEHDTDGLMQKRFILNLTSGFNGLGKGNYQMRREAFKFW